MSGQADIRKWFSRGPAKKPSTEAGKADDAKAATAETADLEGGLLRSCSNEKQLNKPASPASKLKEFAASPQKSSPAMAKARASGRPAKVASHAPSLAEKKRKRKVEVEEDEEDGDEDEDFAGLVDEDEVELDEKPKRSRSSGPAAGRGRGRGKSAGEEDASEGSGRGRGAGRGGGGRGGGGRSGGGGGGGGRGWGAWGRDSGPPPHKGEKEVPEGAEDCLAGLTFVITGVLDSLEREEAEDLIKRHGGRVTGSVSKKTTYLLIEEDSESRKAQKAKELGVKQINEDGLFELIRASNKKSRSGTTGAAETNGAPKAPTSPEASLTTSARVMDGGARPSQDETPKHAATPSLPAAEIARSREGTTAVAAAPRTPAKLSKGGQHLEGATEAWPQKYAPKSTADIVGNQTLVKQLHDWLAQWHQVHSGGKTKGKKGRGGGAASGADKKAVLLSGPPGIGKTTSARLVAAELGFSALEVNASDSRGKADAKIRNGIGGSTANAIKELVSNTSLTFGVSSTSSATAKGKGKAKVHDEMQAQDRAVLIMDEVDGMSGGDRGGVQDLIASIKASRIPIICICNDRYSQKLKSLANYCLPLNYRKPTKQQMAKRLRYITNQEGLQIPENALEELGERVNGDMRMALNQLQYMSLRSKALSYVDVRNRLQASAKDEDIRPMAACDVLLGYNAGRLGFDKLLDAAMSDMDLMPLMVQDNYLNHVPSGMDPAGEHMMRRIASAADVIASGDIVNVQVRRYQQWQHLQFAGFMGCIFPGLLVHGRRVTLEPGERNFDRFPGWLGKNSSMNKNIRIVDEMRSHMVASKGAASPSWQAVRMDYLETLERRILLPLKQEDADAGVQEAAALMEEYSLTPDDLETITTVSKFKGLPSASAGIVSTVKAKLTREVKRRLADHKARSAALLPPLTLKGRGRALAGTAAGAASGKGRRKAGGSSAWADMGAMQADPDVPVAQEDDGAFEDDEEGDADGAEDNEDEEGVRAKLLVDQGKASASGSSGRATGKGKAGATKRGKR